MSAAKKTRRQSWGASGVRAPLLTEPKSRREAPQSAGMSLHQMRTALRVASLGEAVMKRLVDDAEDPATVSQLARLGTKRRAEAASTRRAMNASDRCGPWRYKRSNLTLVHDRGYEVDLERCTDSAHILDWIAQIAVKQVHSDEDLGHFVRALNELLRLQQNVCGQGINKTIDPKRVLR